MSLLVRILDGMGSGQEVHVHKLPTAGKHFGNLALTERFLQFQTDALFFLNDTFGNAMNQAVTFSGSPEGIHDGTDSTLWTGAAITGTWDFADTTNPSAGTKCVSITSANNNDSASFTDGTETNMANFTAMTGLIRLDVYSGVNNTISLQFLNNGANVGNSVLIDDFIDTGSLGAYQSFAINKSVFGIDGETVDQVNMVCTRIGGTKPTFRLDTWQIEAAGVPLEFIARPKTFARFHATKLRFLLIDGLAGTVTDGTMPAVAYNQLLGVSALTNGIVFRSIRKGKTLFAVTLRQLSDFLRTNSNVINLFSDGTNTVMTLEAEFAFPVIFDPNTDDHMSLTINDDLSALIDFTAVLIGGEERAIGA